MVQVKPGGLHIMMLGLNRDLKSGDFVAVTLGFDDGSEKLLQVPVQNTMKKMKKSMKAYKKDGSLPKLITH
jgi:copper(I)-binding protein